ncbi:MAG TPA: FmdB family zinc ribbon protein [Bryobacteraceae bacterium]|jgi:putative FmdB family regulatory protein|nr:FmdB family zinc ribbon protein [Bryobacteraceae bacterium]
MPLYEYRCHKCGQTFEVRQRFADEPLTVHEGCGGEVEKLLSPPALQFKGTGWYVTDYGRNGSSSPDHKSNGKPAEKKTEPAKSETKSESAAAKPAGDH